MDSSMAGAQHDTPLQLHVSFLLSQHGLFDFQFTDTYVYSPVMYACVEEDALIPRIRESLAPNVPALLVVISST